MSEKEQKAIVHVSDREILVYSEEDLKKYIALGYVIKEEIYPEFSGYIKFVLVKPKITKENEEDKDG